MHFCGEHHDVLSWMYVHASCKIMHALMQVGPGMVGLCESCMLQDGLSLWSKMGRGQEQVRDFIDMSSDGRLSLIYPLSLF